MLQLETAPAQRPVVDRSSDRAITMAALGLALVFLLAAMVATTLPPEVRRGLWLPLHLALAGGATTAIAGVMPFFAAAFAAAPPTDARLRVAAVALVALGAAAVSLGTVTGLSTTAVIGGIAFAGGVIVIGLATAWPARRGLGPRGGWVRTAYLIALGEVALGATLATLFLAGWGPSVEEWTRWRPAHAWLNLIGFVSLVIATTLLHFFPTVVGARIRADPSARIVVAGLAAGPALVALGFVLAADLLARAGAVLALAGSAALALYAWRTWRTRARWTSDHGWHRFAMGGLVSATVWFEVGMVLAAVGVLTAGSAPRGWAIESVIAPLAVGWVGISIVASATHLVPAVGPGDQAAHRRQRDILGRVATVRLALLDGGTLALTVGLLARFEAFISVGSALVAVGFVLTVAQLAAASLVGWRSAVAPRDVS